MPAIKFNFEESSKQTITVQGEVGDSILEIALKNDIELHHNCGGVCACSTCHIYIDKGENFIEEISDKEEDFIDRARNPKVNSRLGCQSVLLEGSENIEVTIPDQSVILGK